MVDISETGAGFRNYEQKTPLTISSGDTVHFDVITPFGRGKYQGTVAWASQLEGGHAWGMRLDSSLSADADPLGSLWAAAFSNTDAT